MEGKTNFFEKRVDYSKANVSANNTGADNDLSFDNEDF